MYLLAVVKEMMQYGEIAPRKEYAVTLDILQVGLLHVHILERNKLYFNSTIIFIYYNRNI